jgi:hypothetical protein
MKHARANTRSKTPEFWLNARRMNMTQDVAYILAIVIGGLIGGGMGVGFAYWLNRSDTF